MLFWVHLTVFEETVQFMDLNHDPMIPFSMPVQGLQQAPFVTRQNKPRRSFPPARQLVSKPQTRQSGMAYGRHV